jgi:hypothetical protein
LAEEQADLTQLRVVARSDPDLARLAERVVVGDVEDAAGAALGVEGGAIVHLERLHLAHADRDIDLLVSGVLRRVGDRAVAGRASNPARSWRRIIPGRRSIRLGSGR